MLGPFVLLLASLSAAAAALLRPGLSDLLLLAVPCALASLYLLMRAVLRSPSETLRRTQNYIVIDGSNAMHWKGGSPHIDTLREVVRHLSSLGYTPGVVLDANAGHLTAGRYLHNAAMGRLLGLPEDRVMVVDKGMPADPIILNAARVLGARIVTNDRYLDWVDAHPEVREPGHLIRGGYRAGKLWVALGPVGNPVAE